MKHKGRIICVLLALVLVLGMLCIPAFASSWVAVVIDTDRNECEHCTTLSEALAFVAADETGILTAVPYG